MTISVDELLITEALRARPARPRDLAREIEAINDLARGMVREPEGLQRRFVELALDLCRAGSAGISMLEEAEDGSVVFRWTALAGDFAPYVGGSTPRDFSPCGLCLDRNDVILVSRPARLFKYFSEASAPIVEGLILPLRDADGQPVGAIWVVAHDEGRQFDVTDVAILEQIAGFFALATRMAGDVADAVERLTREKRKRKAAEEALRRAMRMEALGQLTGGVAHDFNNLLMIIGGNLELLKPRIRGPDRPVIAIERAVQRGRSLTRQLLSFSRRQTLHPKIIDLGVRAPKLVELLRASLRGDIEIVTEIDDELWPVEIDSGEFELALINIAVNARDAMPNGGTMVLRMRNHRLNGRTEPTSLAGEFVSVAISDTGTGIPAGLMDKIFEPFFTTKEVGRGTGLGLSQVHGFATQSGGAVTAASREGQGATMTLYLPRAKGSPVPASLEATVQVPCGVAGTVLVVEDNADVADVTVSMLKALGFAVESVAAPQAALDRLTRDRAPAVDAVLSDIVMPGPMNGLDLARAVRQRHPGVPVLLISGYSAAAQQAAEEGFPVLAKPVELHALEAAVRDALKNRVRAVKARPLRR